MTDYYTFLEIVPTADEEDIQSAIDNKYHKWRRLVTHHDHKIADEANQTLRTLEEARSVLLDSAKKQHYDQNLRPAGLADPEAKPILRTPPPPSSSPGIPKTVEVAKTLEPRIDAWVCGKCGTANKTGMVYCKQCGNQIGRECPNCSSQVEASAPFCHNCGVKFSDALNAVKEDYIRQIQYEIKGHLNEISTIEQKRGVLANMLSSAESNLRDYWPYLLVGYAVIFLLSLIIADGAFLGTLLFLTALTVVVWFIGNQKLSESIKKINLHRVEIEELESHVRSLQNKSIEE